MNIVDLIAREAWHRRASTALGVFGVLAACTLFVVFFTIDRASEKETRRTMRDLGYNLRIIPKKTDMDRFWLDGYSNETMPAEYVDRLARTEGLSYNHLIAFLQGRIEIGGDKHLLTGISSEKSPPGQEKPSMIFSVDPGTAYLGYEIWRSMKLGKGDTVDISGNPFRVASCLGETGTVDDGRVWVALGDAQKLLDAKDRINEIKALDCLCLEPDKDPLSIIRAELNRLLPETRVVQLKSLADARARERSTAERRLSFTLPFALVICAAWLALLATLNVRERTEEIGILKALGFSPIHVASIFLGRALLVGTLGGLVGFVAGTFISLSWGPDIFKLTAGSIRTDWTLLGFTMVAAPLFSALVSLVPATLAATRDPAEILVVQA